MKVLLAFLVFAAILYTSVSDSSSREDSCDGNKNAFLEHPTDCSKYIFCDSKGKSHVFQCDENNIFNIEDDQCWPGNTETCVIDVVVEDKCSDNSESDENCDDSSSGKSIECDDSSTDSGKGGCDENKSTKSEESNSAESSQESTTTRKSTTTTRPTTTTTRSTTTTRPTTTRRSTTTTRRTTTTREPSTSTRSTTTRKPTTSEENNSAEESTQKPTTVSQEPTDSTPDGESTSPSEPKSCPPKTEIYHSCPTDIPGVMLIPHPTNCALFLECNNGQAALHLCDSGLFFDVISSSCQPPDVGCCGSNTENHY